MLQAIPSVVLTAVMWVQVSQWQPELVPMFSGDAGR